MRTHPWHPALVHFPIACWSIAGLIDAAALFGALPADASAVLPGVAAPALSWALLWFGVGLGLLAMLLGFVDFLRLPTQLQRSGALSWHVALMAGAWALFFAAAAQRPRPAPPFPPASLAATLTELAGFVLLCAGGALAAGVVFAGWPPTGRAAE